MSLDSHSLRHFIAHTQCELLPANSKIAANTNFIVFSNYSHKLKFVQNEI